MIRYDPNKATLFTPHTLNLKIEFNKCVLIFDDDIWENHIVSNKTIHSLSVTNGFGKPCDTYRYIKNDYDETLLVYPTMGAAGSVCDVELLIASGIKKIVAFGTCGRLNKDIAKNTIILPTSAYREEGTSYHYLPDKDEIKVNKDALRIAEKVLQKHKLLYEKGKIWTTDAVYRETIDKVNLMKSRGCIGVDMELSALLALSEYRNIQFLEFFIGDDLVSVDSEIVDLVPRQNEEIFKTAVEILNLL